MLPCPASCLPACLPACRRMSSFALLKEGSAWRDAASGLLLSFEAVGGCQGSGADSSHSSGSGGGAPGLPLYNHSALNFYGFRGEWPGQEAFVRGDYTGVPWLFVSPCIVCLHACPPPVCWLAANCKPLSKRCPLPLHAWAAPLPAGFQGLECAQLVITTAAPEPPQERLEFGVIEAAPASTPTTSQQRRRRRLHMELQPSAGGSGTLASEGRDSGAACGQPLRLRLQLPAEQQLSSVIWKDGLNRTLHVQTGASLAGGASLAAGGWATADVELPAASVSGGGHYSVLVLAPDGRHTRADFSLESATNSGQLAVRFKYYSSRQLSYARQTLALSWPQAHAPCPNDRVWTQEEGERGASGASKAGGLPIAVLGAAAGGGAVLVVAIVAGCCWHCRRHRRRQQLQREGQAAALERDSAGSSKSGKSDAVVSAI